MGIPLQFIIFGAVLAGVAIFHPYALGISLTGLIAMLTLKSFSADFHLLSHLRAEAGMLANLFGLLLGFAVLARHFRDSRLPLLAPRILPDGWKGPLVLLAVIFLASTFLDNIAAALIGGAMAFSVFRGRVHIAYLAAIVAASNAGGAGSVLGDTTTTMLWIGGVPARQVLHAFIGSGMAVLCLGIPASLRQDRHQRIVADAAMDITVDWPRVALVAIVLAGALLTNMLLGFPALGVWCALLLGAPFVQMPWRILPQAAGGALFLVCLVLIASLLPVEKLPAASWAGTLTLGFVSAFFDNIPLTKLALSQGGYDWGLLAYAVGFGGSMLWFGSSAGVALSGDFPAMRSTGRWLRESWFIAPAYLVGFLAMLAIMGWQPRSLP